MFVTRFLHLNLINKIDFSLKYRRLLLPVFLLVLLFNEDTKSLTLGVLSDAFWQVAVFVAATLTLYHLISWRLGSLGGRSQVLHHSPGGQVVFASFMGAIPGCGGAIIVITQFITGSMRFGSVVAVLTSTMGDAAFLLIAAQPGTGLSVIAVSVAVGILSGLLVNRIHSPDFLRNEKTDIDFEDSSCSAGCDESLSKRHHIQAVIWQLVLLPGAVVGLMMAAQMDVAANIGVSEDFIQLLGAGLAVSLITLWAVSAEIRDFRTLVSEDEKLHTQRLFQKVALDTNFVISWVVMAFLAFELLVFYTALDLKNLFADSLVMMPMLGVLIGMIPGCGPQIITTSLYLNGSIPLSAQLGNAISNDGDALFPALALSPKVAVWATVYSAVPALMVAYGYYWLFEMR